LTQVENLNDIATSFSTFAKMPVPKNEVFDVAQVLRNTTNLYQTDTEHDLQMEIQPGHFWVQADNRLMSRIFTNLVLNALQAVPDDRQAKLRITLATTPQSTVIITFSDNGNGIPDDIRSKVFIPNFSTKSGGSGIGLAVAKRGINHAGGSITFRTTQGQGTTFFVELPLVENPDAGGQIYE
jgi:signal transduction histidine kinase